MGRRKFFHAGLSLIGAASAGARANQAATECRALADYKDWQLLEWDWINDLCDLGVRFAAKKGRWAAVATTGNFIGLQFVGVWRDVESHRRMTDIIHAGPSTLR